jgi:hypothetical protein
VVTGCTDNSESRIIQNLYLLNREKNKTVIYLFIYYVHNTYRAYEYRLTLTYLLTQWSKALLEKLTGSQFIKKIPAFYGI